MLLLSITVLRVLVVVVASDKMGAVMIIEDKGHVNGHDMT